MSDTEKPPNMTACCGKHSYRLYIHHTDASGKRAEIGYYPLCGGCNKILRRPHLYKNAPSGYMDLYPSMKAKQEKPWDRYAFDTKVEAGVLVPAGEPQAYFKGLLPAPPAPTPLRRAEPLLGPIPVVPGPSPKAIPAPVSEEEPGIEENPWEEPW